MEKNCLNCKHGDYWKKGKVICFVHDDLVMENDNCGLWGDIDEHN